MNAIQRLVGEALRHYRSYRRRVLTERILNGLPPSVLRDIGWPDHERIDWN
jgi:hypothetical protein